MKTNIVWCQPPQPITWRFKYNIKVKTNITWTNKLKVVYKIRSHSFPWLVFIFLLWLLLRLNCRSSFPLLLLMCIVSFPLFLLCFFSFLLFSFSFFLCCFSQLSHSFAYLLSVSSETCYMLNIYWLHVECLSFTC